MSVRDQDETFERQVMGHHTQFSREVFCDSTHLVGYIEVSMVAMRDKFGPADVGAYVDEDSGYVGDDMSFAAGDVVIQVYSRWGRPRIGAQNVQDAVLFVEWLRTQGFDPVFTPL